MVKGNKQYFNFGPIQICRHTLTINLPSQLISQLIMGFPHFSFTSRKNVAPYTEYITEDRYTFKGQFYFHGWSNTVRGQRAVTKNRRDRPKHHYTFCLLSWNLWQIQHYLELMPDKNQIQEETATSKIGSNDKLPDIFDPYDNFSLTRTMWFTANFKLLIKSWIKSIISPQIQKSTSPTKGANSSNWDST